MMTRPATPTGWSAAGLARREASLNLVRYGRLIKRWWWLLLFAGAIGGGGAFGVSQMMTPVYRADVTLLINQTQDPGVIAYNDVLTSERLTMTYAEMITKRPILEGVAKAMAGVVTAEQLASMTHVGAITDTQLLRLSVEDTNRDEARALANITANTFITSTEQDGLIRPGTVSIVEPAITPTSPLRPRTDLNTFLGALAGLIVAAVAIAVYEYLDDTVKTSAAVEAVAGISTLGSVSRFRRRKVASRGLAAASGDLLRRPAAWLSRCPLEALGASRRRSVSCMLSCG